MKCSNEEYILLNDQIVRELIIKAKIVFFISYSFHLLLLLLLSRNYSIIVVIHIKQELLLNIKMVESKTLQIIIDKGI